jgi:predicted  nucleic acid-binding Zn-ribbon protein
MKKISFLQGIMCISLALPTLVSQSAQYDKFLNAYAQLSGNKQTTHCWNGVTRTAVPVSGVIGVLGGLYSYFNRAQRPTLIHRYAPVVSGLCTAYSLYGFARATHQLAQHKNVSGSWLQKYGYASYITARHFIGDDELDEYFYKNLSAHKPGAQDVLMSRVCNCDNAKLREQISALTHLPQAHQDEDKQRRQDEITRLQHELKMQQERVAKLEFQLKEIPEVSEPGNPMQENALSVLQLKHEELVGEKNRLQEQLHERDKRLERQTGELLAQQRAFGDVRTDLAAMIGKLALSEQSLQQYKIRMEDFERAKDKQTREMQNYVQNAESSQQTIEKLRIDVRNARSESERLQKQITDLQKQVRNSQQGQNYYSTVPPHSGSSGSSTSTETVTNKLLQRVCKEICKPNYQDNYACHCYDSESIALLPSSNSQQGCQCKSNYEHMNTGCSSTTSLLKTSTTHSNQPQEGCNGCAIWNGDGHPMNTRFATHTYEGSCTAAMRCSCPSYLNDCICGYNIRKQKANRLSAERENQYQGH